MINGCPSGIKEEDKSPLSLIRGVLGFVGKEIESNYCKYFVNNCLILDKGAAFKGDKELEAKCRAELNSFVDKEIGVKKVEKTEVDLYTESFDFRPFFGEGLIKLPKYEKEANHWDWDDLYINPGMKSEVFRPKEEEPKEE